MKIDDLAMPFAKAVHRRVLDLDVDAIAESDVDLLQLLQLLEAETAREHPFLAAKYRLWERLGDSRALSILRGMRGSK